ncbi:glycosyltransferase family 1 protein [Rhodococcus aerolatus]
MRIAVVAESFLPQVNGVSGSVVRVLEHLRHRGHDTLVVAPGVGEAAEHHGTPVVRVPAVDVPRVSSLPVGLPTPAVTTALADFDPDVVHLASPFVLGAGGQRAARRLGVPTVAVYQTDVAGFAASYGMGATTTRAAWRWTRRLHGQADRTLAPSTWAVEALTSRGVPRVHRWGRGVDTTRFAPAHRSDALHARLAPHGELLVGFVGRLAPEKHVERLALLAATPGVRLVVTGDGPERARLERLVPGAVFLGRQGGAELARTMASLDVAVHPGEHETFCQVVQEALASGVPVVAADAGGPRDLVAHGRTGFLVPVEDLERATVAAVLTLADPELRRSLGRAARRSVLRRTWPVLGDELLGHYRAVLGSADGLATAA